MSSVIGTMSRHNFHTSYQPLKNMPTHGAEGSLLNNRQTILGIYIILVLIYSLLAIPCWLFTIDHNDACSTLYVLGNWGTAVSRGIIGSIYTCNYINCTCVLS